MKKMINLLRVMGMMVAFLATTSYGQHRFPNEQLRRVDKKYLTVEMQVPARKLTDVVKKLKEQDLDVIYVDKKSGSIQVLSNQEDYKKLMAFSSFVQVTASRYVNSLPDQQYKTPDEVKDIIQTYKQKFPNLVTVYNIGKTLEGRDILALRISDDAQENKQEPAILFNALHHAREVMTVEIALDIIDYLTANYGKDATVTNWVNKAQIWIIPMVNPDGSNRVWNEDNMWRKNARGDYGVDINRNYPYKWGACDGSSGSKYAQDYRGESAASEPETNVMMNFVANIKPIYNISYHSYGGMVLYPFGCSGTQTPPAEKIAETGKEMAALLNYEPGTPWQILYDVDGGDVDWMYATHHVIPFVIEVSTKMDGFQPPYSRRDAVVQLNRKGWQYLLNKLVGTTTKPTSMVTITWKPNNFMMMHSRMVQNSALKLYRFEAGKWMFVAGNPTVGKATFQNYILEPGHYRIYLINAQGQGSYQDFNLGAGTKEAILF